ncbi:probable G-protein coupled receptor 82 [Colossoma macropomum]|uniref:probable G-protein coupled receptor 82 n=1 Tax=Colossoma macropomum TaxID=42526 RepID=UPI0018649BA3|nr:probable G-protein coupled receptor 82 [Colossoma macropomum]
MTAEILAISPSGSPMAVCPQLIASNNSICLCQTFTTHLFLPILYSAMFLTGLAGNVLSLWIFMAKISGKSPTHIYLINLGISNLLLCLTMPFIAAYYALGTSWSSRSSMCRLAINVLTPVLHTNIGVGMIILAWLALSRCATLVQHSHGPRPSKCTKVLPKVFFSRLRQTSFALGVCLGTWAIVATASIPSVVVYSMKETEVVEDGDKQMCYSVAVEVGGSGSQAFAMIGIVIFFLCLLVVLSAYMAVIRHFYRSRKSTIISDRQRVYVRVFRNIVVIQFVLVVCLLPYHIYKAIFINLAQTDSRGNGTECHSLSTYVEIKNVLLCLAALRCSTDPIMYFLLDKTFKRHTLCLFRGSSNTQDSHSSRTECGQSAPHNNSSSKGAATHNVHSYSKD